MFKDLKNYKGLYQISDTGIIKSIRFNKEKIMKLSEDKDGYLRVGLFQNKKQKHFFVHRLVAETFIKKIKGKDFINHKDGNKKNNNVTNLEWVTRKENEAHKYNVLGIVHNMKINNHRKGKKGKLHFRSIRIGQYEDGNLINSFYGSYEAQEKTGIQQGNIIAVCKGKRKQAGGYTWKYL